MTATSNWLSGVPSRWGAMRTKFLFNREQRAVGDSDEIVTAFRDGQVTLRRNRRTEGFTNSVKEIGYQGIRSGDLVVHAMDAFAGAIGISDSDGKATPVYSVCTPLRPDVFTPYYARLLRHMALTGFVESLSKGVRERSTEFRWAELAEVELPVPPKSEQESIANFLDQQTARIDALIAEKDRLLDVLAEQRVSVAEQVLAENSTLTRGKLGFYVDLLPGYSFSSDKFTRNPDDIPLLRGVNVAPAKIRWDDTVYWTHEGTEALERFRLQVDDVVLGMDRPWISAGARVAMIDATSQGALLLQRVCRLRGKGQMKQRFIFYVLSSDAFRQSVEVDLTGVSVPHISPEQVLRFKVPVLSLDEQQRRCNDADSQIAQIVQLEAQTGEMLDRLREYRSSLISAAVTGQLDINSYKEAA